MSVSPDAAAYAVVYSVLLLHNALTPSLTLSGSDWTFTRLICLATTPGIQ